MYIKENKYKQHEKIGLIAPYFIVALLVMGMRYRAFIISALLVCVSLLFICDENEYIPLLFFLVPFANIFKLSANGSSFFTYIELLFVMLHFIKTKRPIKLSHVLIIMLSIFVCLSEVINQTLDVKRTIKFISNIILLSILVDIDDKKNTEKLFKYYVIGFVLSGIIAQFGTSYIPINQYVKTQVSRYNDGSEINRFAGLYPDPNYFSINIIICILLSILLYYKKTINLFAFLVFICFLTFFIGKSGSKSALIMLIIPILVLFSLTAKKKKFLTLFVCFIALSILFYLSTTGRIGIFSNTIRRFSIDSKEGIDQLSTGRYNIWMNYYEYFLSNPISAIIGNGIGVDYLDKSATHNTYIDLIYQLGIIGTLLYVWFIREITNSPKRVYAKRDVSNAAIWVCILVMYFFLSQLQEFDLPFQIALAILWYNYDINTYRIYDGNTSKPKYTTYLYEH